MKRKIYLYILFGLVLFNSVVEAETCEGLFTYEAASLLTEIINYVRIGVPILLIILCASDFAGVVASEDDNAMKKAVSKVVKRCIAAAAIFFVPLIIQFVLSIDAVKNSLNLVDDPSCGIGTDSDDELKDKYKTEEELEKEAQERLEEERKKKEEEEKKKQEEEEKKKQEEEEKKQEEEKKEEESTGDPGNISGNYPPKKVTDNITKNYYKSFTYYLYLPDKVTKNLPIVLFMPGLGQKGNDYFNSAKTGISCGPLYEVYKYDYSYDAIIVVPQVPSSGNVYQYINDYVSLLNKIADEFDANKSKISAMGFSHGCYGMVNLISAYPKYFSAAVFVGCAPNKKNDISKFTNQPVWTFVGGGDGVSDYKDQYGDHYSMQNFVNEINRLGGNAKHTNAKNKVHNILNDSYSILRDKDYNVIEWMISQKR